MSAKDSYADLSVAPGAGPTPVWSERRAFCAASEDGRLRISPAHQRLARTLESPSVE